MFEELPEITIKIDKLTQKKAKELGQLIEQGGFKTGLILYQKIYKYAWEEIAGTVAVNSGIESIILMGPEGQKMEFTEHPRPV